jgi:hypothetical protein
VPAIFGAVAVIMTHANVTDSAAEAGHAALNKFVQSAIAQIVASIGPGHQMVTQQDIDSVTSGANDTVRQAIINAQSVWQNLWAAIDGADQTAGHMTWVWNQDQFPSPTELDMSSTVWTNGVGLWGIDGDAYANDRCAPQASMAAKWWQDRAAAYVPEIGRLLIQQKPLNDSVASLISATEKLFAHPTATVSRTLAGHLRELLAAFVHSSSRPLSSAARRAIESLPSIEGKSLQEATSILDTAIPQPRGQLR